MESLESFDKRKFWLNNVKKISNTQIKISLISLIRI